MIKNETINSDFDGEYRTLGPKIGPGSGPLRLDAYLAVNYPFWSRSKWQKKLRVGEVRVNNAKMDPSYRLREGDVIAIFHPHRREPEVDHNIFPIFKDGGVMAFYKPANLPMHENGPYRKNTFCNILKQQFGSSWAPIHRLDRETSGIVLCGNTPKIRQNLAGAFAHKEVTKEYLAIVKGIPTTSSWREDGSIGDLEDSLIRIKKWVVPNGLAALTFFQVLEKTSGYSLLLARPKTGRTNQIRIHAAVKGFPIVGDKLYHPDESVFIEYFENGGNTKTVLEKVEFHRLCLHAAGLEFTHPETDQICKINSPLPEDMEEFWQRVKLRS